MDEIIEGWVTELSPIHETGVAFEKGGPECGRTILRLYQDLLEAESLARELESEVEDLQCEVDDLKKEISGLKKENGNGK